MAECIALVMQVADGRILDGESEETTPSAEDEKNDLTEIAKTFGFVNN